MPELPEVETVVRDLRPLLVGRRFLGVWSGNYALRQPWDPAWNLVLPDQTVTAIDRRGKWIVVRLDTGACLVVHLGMTGQLTVAPPDTRHEDHTHLIFALDDGGELRYRDIRRFGGATLFADAAAVEAFFRATALGPEPFGLDAKAWRASLAGTTRLIKAALLDQSLVAGVGNIYADESLFVAKIHPERRACDLTAAEADRLRKAIGQVLTRAIDRRGSSIRNYVGGSGLAGGYQEEFRVYGRTAAPCPRCKTPVARLRLGGRSSHFCPTCQPAVATP